MMAVMKIRNISLRSDVVLFFNQDGLRLMRSVVLGAAALFISSLAYAVEPYFQGNGDDGLVSMEAEEYHEKVKRGDHEWVNYSAAGSSDDGALRAMPNNGTVFDTNYVSESPSLSFSVHFNRAGLHYLWVRSLASGRADDTLHAGLNGVAVASAAGIGLPRRSWGWANMLKSGLGRAELVVPSAGLHTVNLWMREDGAAVDKIVLTSRSDYVPEGLGPDTSPRELPPEPSQVLVSWEAPDEREDLSSLEVDDIDGYEVHYGLTPALSEREWVEGGDNTSLVVEDLPSDGVLYVAVRAFDIDGLRSDLTTVVQHSLQ